MVQFKRDTFEDLIGNFADDAKQALDEILERSSAEREDTPATQNVGLPDVAGPVGAAGDVAGTIGGLSATVGSLAETVEELADLPEQIAKLSVLMSTLIETLEGVTGTLGSVGRVAGRAKKATSSAGKS